MIFLLLKVGSESDVSYGVNLNLKERESGSDANYDASYDLNSIYFLLKL
jgi:hypothetical protein